MTSRPSLVDTPPFEPVPGAFLVDTSVLMALGATGADKTALVDYMTTTDKRVYLSPYVVDELKTGDVDDYGVNGWLEEVRQREWLETLPSLDEGIRIHDAPKAGVMMDRAHERLAKLEQREQDSVRKTDPAFAGCFVQLLGGYGYDEVGLVIDDRKAEQALSAVVAGTDYESAVRLFRGDEFLEMMREFHHSH
jgi:hypothetical protein